MKRVMMCITAASFLCFALCTALLAVAEDVFLALAVTFGTILYHFAMRLAVGGVINTIRVTWDPDSFWLRQKSFEPRLYKILRVKKWKDKMPTYSPGDFSMEEHTPEELVQTMCRSEICHQVIIPLSFLPLLLAIPFGEMAVFAITSTLGALFDMAFVVMQRYNRPRVMRIIKMKRKTSG